MKASKEMEKYFEDIDKRVRLAHAIASKAKKKGYDPEDTTIPLAKDMAERIENLIATKAPQIKGSGVVERLKELEKVYGSQEWQVAFKLAEEVAQQKFCKFESEEEAMEIAMRVGLAYITVGVVASPLEGFVRLKLRDRKDGKGKYFALFFGGPIRSAGTTATCAFVCLCDYVRTKMGYQPYDPTEEEIKRNAVEIVDFHERVTNLQYFPSVKEVEFLTKNLPVQIDGDASEKLEVSRYKGLDRVETDRLRNGFCLAMAEGLAQKGKKFWGRFSKWSDEFGMSHWNFMKDFVKLQEEVKAHLGKSSKADDVKLKPDFTFIKDLVAGRPVITHPLENGGLRLRYGRTRLSGFSADGMHPATMIVLKGYIATGTQFKVERPGKSTCLTICDSIDGPIVKLKNGSVVRLETEEIAKKYVKDIEEILFLGDILINYGDFLDRGHKLIPSGFCEEWWVLYLEKWMKANNKNVKETANFIGVEEELIQKLLDDSLRTKISAEDAIKITEKTGIYFHPRYIYHWKELNLNQLKNLIKWLRKANIDREKNKIVLPVEYKIEEAVEQKDPKRILELIGLPHKEVKEEYVSIEKDDALGFLYNLGLHLDDSNLDKFDCVEKDDVLDCLNEVIGNKLKDKSGTTIGARMGRPEKAKMRKLKGSPHSMFPVGDEGGRMRCFQAALEAGKITSDFPVYYCSKCDKQTIYPKCEICDEKTTRKYFCKGCDKLIDEKECSEHGECVPYKKQELDINHYFGKAVKKLKLRNIPELVKGVRGTSNEDHTPENLMKGILRAKHKIYSNKEGTTRYDMSELPMTHFKPSEVGTSIEKLKELGYLKDVNGKPLVDKDQVLEIKPQDVVLPACDDALEEGADEVLFRVAKFIDELLVKVYDLEPYYNLKKKEDLTGHLCVSLSPHTVAGAVIRIVGFSKTQGFFTNPLVHSLMRRDADGDEAGVMLLMDALVNFSRRLLPNTRGITQDTPIVLTSRLIPAEVDDMVFNMDITDKYPLELYEAAEEYKYPWDIKIEKMGDHLDDEGQYEGWRFTHPVSNMNAGARCSAYKSIPTMMEKVLGQMELAEKIRAVDEIDTARLVIDRHFIRDIKGNLRKFSMQQFRCVKCNEKYRRPPLNGKCKCGGKIIFTISEGSIIKYLEPSLELCRRYDLPPYLKQTIELVKQRIDAVFGKDPEKQEGLVKWFGGKDQSKK